MSNTDERIAEALELIASIILAQHKEYKGIKDE
jgi:hypothetical protein